MMLGLVPSPASQQIPVGLNALPRLRWGGFEGLVPSPFQPSGLGAYDDPGSDFCAVYPDWLMTTSEFSSCYPGPVTPPVQPVPTQAQLDAVAASPDPGAAAAALTQELSNQQVLAAQAANAAAINALPVAAAPPIVAAPAAPPPVVAVPFCGTGSNQWVQGVDNCVLLGVVGVGFVAVIMLSGSRGGRRR